jgi:hypothetical protein
MLKNILLIIALSYHIVTNANSCNIDTLEHSIYFQYGIDLTDTFKGLKDNLKSTDYTSYVSVNYSIAHNWYGVNTHFGMIRNSDYLVPRSSFDYTFYIPDNTLGFVTGVNAAIIPFKSKFFELQIETGFQYSIIKYEYCYTWHYTVNGQTATLDWAKYQTKTYKGFSFNFGLKTNLRLYHNISLLLFGRATSALSDSNVSFFLTGAGVEYKF